jgi:outer membrane protein assembly factor BamB
MKISRLFFVSVVLILGILLSGCGSALMASSWTGVTADETLAYLTKGSDLFAVNLTNGTLAWRYPEKSTASIGFYSNPVKTPDGQILVAAYDHKLYSLGNDGLVNWTFEKSKNRLVGSPLVTEDSIYQPSTDGNLYCLDLEGNQKWVFTATQALWSTPVTDGDLIFVTSMDHFLYALDKQDGTELWKAELGGAIPGSASLSEEGVLYAGTLTKEIAAVDAANGEVLWKVPVGGSVWSAPLVLEDSLFFGDTANKIYRMAVADGSILWQIDTDGVVTGAPAMIENGLVFGTETGTLMAIDLDGKSLWNQTINGKLYSGLVVAKDLVLAGVTGGDQLVIAYNLNGSQAWPFTPPK